MRRKIRGEVRYACRAIGDWLRSRSGRGHPLSKRGKYQHRHVPTCKAMKLNCRASCLGLVNNT